MAFTGSDHIGIYVARHRRLTVYPQVRVYVKSLADCLYPTKICLPSSVALLISPLSENQANGCNFICALYSGRCCALQLQRILVATIKTNMTLDLAARDLLRRIKSAQANLFGAKDSRSLLLSLLILQTVRFPTSWNWCPFSTYPSGVVSSRFFVV